MADAVEKTGGALIDALLESYRSLLGGDWQGYRNYCRRTLAFTLRLHPVHGEEAECLATAVAFHDLGVWATGSLDYLEPSVVLASAYLDAESRPQWRREVAAIIRDHHKLTPSSFGGLAEAFRKADAIDLSGGLLRFGLGKQDIGAIRAAFPNAGFHRCLARRLWRQILSAPRRSLPMIRC